MSNKSFIFLTVLMFVLGCSTRKVLRDKTEIDYSLLDKGKIKLDSGKTNLNLNYVFNYSKGLKLTPLDTSKPMEINGKKYKNVKIESEEKNKGIVNLKKDSVYKSSQENKDLKEELNVDVNKKESESKKQGFVFLYIAIASLVVCLIFLYRYFRR